MDEVAACIGSTECALVQREQARFSALKSGYRRLAFRTCETRDIGPTRSEELLLGQLHLLPRWISDDDVEAAWSVCTEDLGEGKVPVKESVCFSVRSDQVRQNSIECACVAELSVGGVC